MSDASAANWYVYRDGQLSGPYTPDQFQALETSHALRATDYIWKPNASQWVLNAARQTARPWLRRLSQYLYKPLRPILGPMVLLTSNPSLFAQQRIDVRSGDTGRAVSYFVKVFAVVFALSTLLTYFAFSDPTSQPRRFALIGFQLAIAALVVYLGNRALRQKVRLAGVAQSIVYVDALFIFAEIAAAAPLVFAIHALLGGRGEIDVIETEYRTCLADSSLVYFLTRGPVAAYTHADYTPLAAMLDQIGMYIGFVVVLPFCYLAARLLNARYSASILANSALVFLAYGIVSYGGSRALAAIDDHVYRNSDCLQRIAQIVARKYGRAMVAEQVRTRLSKAFAENNPTPPRIDLYDGAIVFTQPVWTPVLINPGTTFQEEARRDVREALLKIYCADWWVIRTAREIEVPLEYRLEDATGSIFYTEKIGRKDCEGSPAG